MKKSFICCFFLLFFTTTFAQTKQELNFEVTNLKEQVKTLEASNQVLIVKTASLEKDVEYLQKQIDELKLLVNSQAQRMPTQEISNSTAPSLPQASTATPTNTNLYCRPIRPLPRYHPKRHPMLPQRQIKRLLLPTWRLQIIVIWLCTHDAGNTITEKDWELAREIDLLVA
ncbi:MAG: hypothetical protein EB003_02940 [Flavobacteriia bacterium]|nr:hypothetical protein [Flavobacteriia bacterium]